MTTMEVYYQNIHSTKEVASRYLLKLLDVETAPLTPLRSLRGLNVAALLDNKPSFRPLQEENKTRHQCVKRRKARQNP